MATKKLSSDESRFSPKKMSWKLAIIEVSLIFGYAVIEDAKEHCRCI